MTLGERSISISNEHQVQIGENITTYPMELLSSQTKLSVHPTVVSPRRLRQLSIRSKEKAVPATSAVNRMRMVAQT